MDLKETIKSLNLKEDDAMNALQDAGVISDLCVDVGGVAAEDHSVAIAELKKHYGPEQPMLI